MRKGTKKLAIALSLAMMLPSVAMPGTIPARAATIEDVQLVSAVSLPDGYNGIVEVNETYFPNVAFRTYISTTYAKYITDGKLDTTKITTMDLSGTGIEEDIRGIEYFTSLEYLNCSYKKLKTLDISTLTKLKALDCSHNALTALDVSKNTLLTVLYCGNQSIDFEALDVSKLTELEVLSCRFNPIKVLNLDNNTKLKYLDCELTGISSISLKNCAELEALNCSRTELKTLDLSGNNALAMFICYGTKLSSLDISNHPALTDVYVGYNKVKGDSKYLKTLQEAKENKNDDGTYITDYYKDSFSSDILSTYGDLTDYFSDEVAKSANGSLTSLNVSNCPALKNVYCDNNAISSLTLTGDTALENLYCSNNKLANVDLTGLDSLNILSCGDNILGTGDGLNVAGLDNLEYLFCANNQFEKLDITQNNMLKVFDCSGNRLINLDIKAVAETLLELNCNKNALKTLDLNKLNNDNKTYALQYLYCNDNNLTSLNINDTSIANGNNAQCNNNSYPIKLNDNFEFELVYLPGKPAAIGSEAVGIDSFENGVFFYNGSSSFSPKTGVTSASYNYVIGQDESGADIKRTFTLTFDSFNIVVLLNGSEAAFNSATSKIFEDEEIECKAVLASDHKKKIPNVTWHSSDENVVTIDSKTGVMKGVGAGKAQISVWTHGKERGYIEIEVVRAVKGITIKQGDEDITGKTVELSAGSYVEGADKTIEVKGVVNPSDATNQNIQFTSSDTSKARIAKTLKDGNNVAYGAMIEALAGGKVTITAKAQDGSGVVSTFDIDIEQFPNSMNIQSEGNKTLIGVGKTLQLNPVIKPDNTADKNKNVEWSVDDETVATIDINGMLTGVSEGQVTVTCKSTIFGQVVATRKFNVVPRAELLTLDKTSYTLKLGKEPNIALIASILPTNSYSNKVIWTSSNEKVATVTAAGYVRSVAPGKTVIRATSEAYDDVYAECEITVEQIVTGVRLDTNRIELGIGQSKKLTATLTPANATNKNVTWTSEDASIATVAADGTVTAKKPGQTRVLCTAADGSGRYAACTVVVIQPVTKITVKSTTKSTILKGKSIVLKATILPDNAKNKNVVWKSSDSKIAIVSGSGASASVRGVKKGTATITCEALDGSGVKASYKVTVTNPVTKITLKKTSLKLKKGRSYTLKYTVGPKSATNKKVKWTTSNKKIATVSTKGKVTAKRKKGTAVIKCTAADGSGVYATCTVTVR